MTTKATALATSVSAVCLYVFSLIAPNDLYFYFISPNPVVSILRVVLAGLIAYLAIKQKFVYRCSSLVCSVLGIILTAFGLAGLAVPVLDYDLFNIVRPLDFLYLVGTGIFMGYLSLALAPGRRKLQLPQVASSLPLRLSTRLTN